MKKEILTGCITGLFFVGIVSIANATPISGGLLGQYYDDATYYAPSWNNLKYEQINSVVDFDWGLNSPNTSLLGNDSYSIKWSGWVKADSNGTYTFQLSSDDSSMLYIDDTTVVDNSGNHATQYRNGDIDLTAGLHKIVLTFHEWTGWANVALMWDDNGTYNIIDSSHLYHNDGNNPVPEPATMLLFGTGLIGLVGWKKRENR